MLSRRRALLPGLCLAVLLAAGGSGGCGGGKKSPGQDEGPSPTELYRRAEALMAQRKYGRAISTYNRINTARDRELRAQVHLRLADAYFEKKNVLNLAEAQSRYRSFLNFFPLSDQAAYAQYQYARTLSMQINKPERDQTSTHRAIAEFHKVEELYPNSSWVAESRARIAELEDHLSRDALIKARFYYNRKRYRAAILRLERILEQNPDFDRREEVLYYLGMAHRKNGDTANSDNFLQQLIADFPDSKYASRAREKLRPS